MSIVNVIAVAMIGLSVGVGAARAQDKPVTPDKPATPEKQPAPAKEPEKAPAKPIGEPVTKPNGLIIEDLKIGDGPEAKPGTGVVVNYVGTLRATGVEFDSSAKRGPLICPLREGKGGVIAGWVQGVPGMTVGGKRRLTIPAALGYKEREFKRGDKVLIPANSDLVFEIELIAALQIEDIKVGEGAEAKPGATVVVQYAGTLKTTGAEFDSSRGEPFTTPLRGGPGGVIDGWVHGIPGMKVGGKRKITIPWQMAYGEMGSPPKIPGKADLVFEVELVGVK